MKRTLITEGVTLAIFSIGGIFGGISLYLNRDARTQSSVLAPGTYILALSGLLLLTTLGYVYLSSRKVSRPASVDSRQPQAPRVSTIVLKMVGAFALYAFLIDLIGYTVPTLLYLLTQFRLLGVKSWKTNLVLTALITALFYIVFVHYCEMIFPHGSLFE